MHYQMCESKFADVPFTVVLNLVENLDTDFFSKHKESKKCIYKSA